MNVVLGTIQYNTITLFKEGSAITYYSFLTYGPQVTCTKTKPHALSHCRIYATSVLVWLSLVCFSNVLYEFFSANGSLGLMLFFMSTCVIILFPKKLQLHLLCMSSFS